MTRRLSDRERELWDHVTSGVKPRRLPAAKPAMEPLPAPQPDLSAAAPVRRRRVTVKPAPAAPPEPATAFTPARDPFAAPQLDGKRASRFMKGEIRIEGRIDLHGLTLDMAHKALAGFLMQARGRGHRMVLVITGKGVGKGGALKRLVPLWLSAPPFAGLIAGLAAAQARHGGEGALYLYLRRKRDETRV